MLKDIGIVGHAEEAMSKGEASTDAEGNAHVSGRAMQRS